jgi:hypothetical protein
MKIDGLALTHYLFTDKAVMRGHRLREEPLENEVIDLGVVESIDRTGCGDFRVKTEKATLTIEREKVLAEICLDGTDEANPDG